jgi:hypothetical protein
MNRKMFEKPANKIIQIFSDEQLETEYMGYVAMNVVLDSYPSSVTDKIQVFCEAFIDKRATMGYTYGYEQDKLF